MLNMNDAMNECRISDALLLGVANGEQLIRSTKNIDETKENRHFIACYYDFPYSSTDPYRNEYADPEHGPGI